MSADESDLSDSDLNQIEPDSDGYTSEESIPPDESTDEGKSAIALYFMIIIFQVQFS